MVMYSRKLNEKEATGHAADNGTTQAELAPTRVSMKGSTVRVWVVKADGKISKQLLWINWNGSAYE